ncbi:hypothetical protein ILYODFUR_007909, partial [Ilyodon furcidens]
PLLSTGTERDSLRRGSSGWTPDGSAGHNRSRRGCGGLQPGRKPPAAELRHRMRLNTESRG